MSSVPNATNSTSTDYYTAAAGTKTTNQELDKNAFLNLLMTQLKYQDPMKPMDDQAFIAQMAQFSSLEKMQEVSAKLDIVAASAVSSTATSLIGHRVTLLGPYDDAPTMGLVQAIAFEGGQPRLVIDGQTYDPAYVTLVQ
ncbi:MAG: flagellar hook assembly protein FlgD [Armatimonadota bacterium]